MLPVCRTEGDGFAIPTFDVTVGDVDGFMDELREFQSAFHDGFARSEPREHFFDYMVGQLSALDRKSIEPPFWRSRGGASAACSVFSVMSPGMRSTWCGRTIISSPRTWGTRTGL